jgi:hypothetical protein
LNYLRNGNTTGLLDFFVNAPQEFFASISNQWFTNSEKVLELGLVRYDKKYFEPLNQFLFYTDVYSLESDSTIFYSNDINGNISSKKIPITRDIKGHVNSIKINNKIYNFVLDSYGNVTGYSVVTLTLITATGLTDKKVIISPNPFDQSIKIEFPEDFGPFVHAKIHDVKGVVVWEKESVRDAEMVDLSSLSVGNYVLNLTSQTNGQVSVVKISKQGR